MKPYYFTSEQDSVFGVYHSPTAVSTSSSNAVVVCPAFGQEAIRSHKCLMSLANRLAKSGVHVLRFAYRGTDDSSLWSDEVCSLKDWQRDIVAAKEQLKRLSGCESVMLLGLRLGANLAIEVAQISNDVHSLVLWEPIEDGSLYLANLRKNQAEMVDLWHRKLPQIDTDEIEELFSTRYQRCLLREIEQVRIETQSLRQPTWVVSANTVAKEVVDAPSEPILTRDDMEKRTVSREPDGWKELEQLEVVWWRPQSLNQLTVGVQEMFRRIEAYGWHRQYVATAVNSKLHEGTKGVAILANANSSHKLSYELPANANRFDCNANDDLGYCESVLSFGQDMGLTAVLTNPSQPSQGSPVVIMLNAGIVHRVGPFRLHVQLARQLAKAGFASLRIDLSGLGDSKPRTGKQNKDERVRLDLTDAIKCIEDRGLGNRFVLFGLCSGAFQAHQAAISEPRVIGGVFMDGIVFRTRGFYIRHHLGRLLRPRFWRNAIKRRLLNYLRKDGKGFQEEGNKLAEAEFFKVDRSRQEIATEINELKKREAQMLFLYTGDYDDVCGRNQFREMYGIRPDDQIQVDYLAHASHTLRIASHRNQLCQRVAEWMHDRFGARTKEST